MSLTSLSFAYPEVPAKDRARMLEPRTGAFGDEVFVLTTCLRVEVAWSGGPDLSDDVLEQLFDPEGLPSPETRTDFDAFHHLARVAAGLESAQVGEVEVLSQFRHASDELLERSQTRSPLVSAVERALGVARIARRSLTASRNGSLASAAAHLVESMRDVVVLGGGAMGSAVVRHLKESSVRVYTRNSKIVGGVPSRPWAEVRDALRSCAAAVSTVPGPVPALWDLGRPEGETLLLVDLGMPPAVPTPDLPTLIYRGVDDVAASLSPTPQTDADEIVAIEAEKAWERLTVSRDASSMITSVVNLVDQTVDEEVRRFARRLRTAEEPDRVLRQLAHTVARRIIHPSVSLLGSAPLTTPELDILARALGVDHE